MKYFYCLLILICHVSLLAQCEEYEKQNLKLIAEKSELQKKLNQEEIAYDKLHLKYQREVEERKKCERLYYIEKRSNRKKVR